MTGERTMVAFDEVFTPITPTSRAPRYAQVIAQIETAIRRGLLTEGLYLPPERDLCDGFGVARTTLRRAMGELEERGAVSRTRRRGTRIEGAAAIDYHPATSHTIFELITASHRQPKSTVEVFEHVTADAGIAQLTGFRIGTPLVWMVRDRSASDVPVARLENYVIAEAVSFGGDELIDASLDVKLTAHGWTSERIEYELEAILVDETLDQFMRVPVGTPVLREHRRAFVAGEMFNYSRNTYHPVNYRIHGFVNR